MAGLTSQVACFAASGEISESTSSLMKANDDAAFKRHKGNILTSQMIPDEASWKGQDPGEPSKARAAASASKLLASARCVAAIDMDCFYAQCEELRQPELRGKPIGVQQKALVITSNYAARAYGIEKGDSLKVVREKCPNITICNGEDLTFYGEISQAFFDVASRWTDKVEKLGLDEIFMDLTEAVDQKLAAIENQSKPRALPTAFGTKYPDSDSPELPGISDSEVCWDWQTLDDEQRCTIRLALGSSICAEIRHAIHTEVGLTSSAGVSVSKMLAKLVASWRKPAQQTIFLPTASNLGHLLPDSLAIQKIPGIGFSSTQKCNELGIKTISDLVIATQSQDSAVYKQLSGKFDKGILKVLRASCLGLDDTPIKLSGPPKSCSVEDSFWQKPLRSDSQVSDSLHALARKLLVKIRSDEKRFGSRHIPTLAVSLRHVPEPSQGNSRRERRQIHLDGSLRLAMRPGMQCESNGRLTLADETKITQIVERAFGLFRKMVPCEPFALHILSMQVAFGEALPATQQLLSFTPRNQLNHDLEASRVAPMVKQTTCSNEVAQLETLEKTQAHQEPQTCREGVVAHVPSGSVNDMSEKQGLPMRENCDNSLCCISDDSDQDNGHIESADRSMTNLINMGFTKHQARNALERSNGDLNSAIELILARGDSTHASNSGAVLTAEKCQESISGIASETSALAVAPQRSGQIDIRSFNKRQRLHAAPSGSTDETILLE